MKIISYLNFNGNAEEALNFYQQVFGGQTSVMHFSEMPADPETPVSPQWAGKLMHGSLEMEDGQYLYLSDSFEGSQVRFGDSITVHLEFDSEDALRRTFGQLSEGATITMPVEKVFWGAIYGSLVDKFGIPWGLHYELPAE
ncbi:MAG: VOC family protein [Spirochaetes bacterium]|nr:VOC family protein [Spirochaetota bacterium]